MDEAQWLAATDPDAMMAYLESRVSPFRTRWQGVTTVLNHPFNQRKQQLFGTACCRRLGAWLPASYRAWLDGLDEMIEGRRERPRYPADLLDEEELDHLELPGMARRSLWQAMTSVGRVDESIQRVSHAVGEVFAHTSIRSDLETWVMAAQSRAEIVHEIPEHVVRELLDVRQRAERAIHAVYLRDLVGNPFRRVEFIPRWRSADAIAMAQRMYDECDFEGMPILADALEEAGCDQSSILEHCRGADPHIRGCWVVDAILCRA